MKHMAKFPWMALEEHLKIKCSKITIKSPEEFCFHANKIIPSISSMYLPLTEILKEADDVAQVPAIHSTLLFIHLMTKVFSSSSFSHYLVMRYLHGSNIIIRKTIISCVAIHISMVIVTIAHIVKRHIMSVANKKNGLNALSVNSGTTSPVLANSVVW